ncbi:succinate dehydrogenase cytochrome b subunit [Nocardiopsis composta]|uniref:Succinate dehydrogenase / fumarate reductase cytochrome b subunit n=1 Tax=Nocardiopsis composta TaxID=157465 RepID=A0A7W8QRF7_9ACTN|nr:succinate dehydrogenase cytochrome b subunit [Nocardiopsis composta]MBB5434744.1 succinate dehydrogenase / fumarate reductase cytochrome b subunit [Nocardiopsis composta]
MANSTLTKQRSEARRSSVALKSAMAVTGAILVLFLIAHMYGNLNVFAGQETFDNYSHHLRELGEPMLPHEGFLWIMRVALLAAILIHIYSAVVLSIRARKARPVRYVKHKSVQQTYASRTMRWGGVIIALYVVFHVLHLTTNTIAPGGKSDSPYERLVNGFQPEYWYVTLVYVAAVILVGLHVRHGIWSACATLGLNREGRRRTINAIAIAIAAVITVGFLLPPFSVLLGLVG